MDRARHQWVESPWRLAAELLASVLPLARLFDRRFFDVWERHGFHIVPVHFYEPLPSTADLTPSLWDWRSRTLAFDMCSDAQHRLLSDLRQFQAEFSQLARQNNPFDIGLVADAGAFGPVDADVLYALIRHVRPTRVVEIGSGLSTWIAASALEANRRDGGPSATLTAIEPYPLPPLERGFPGLIRLIREKLQDVDERLFLELQPGDILFIDSSHVHKLGSDVQRIFSRILPAIGPGVYVHFHDIFLPSEYPETWVKKRRLFWNEQHFLESFLAFNHKFRVVWGSSFLHLTEPALLAHAFPLYDPQVNWPASLWVQRLPAARPAA